MPPLQHQAGVPHTQHLDYLRELSLAKRNEYRIREARQQEVIGDQGERVSFLDQQVNALHVAKEIHENHALLGRLDWE